MVELVTVREGCRLVMMSSQRSNRPTVAGSDSRAANANPLGVIIVIRAATTLRCLDEEGAKTRIRGQDVIVQNSICATCTTIIRHIVALQLQTLGVLMCLVHRRLDNSMMADASSCLVLSMVVVVLKTDSLVRQILLGCNDGKMALSNLHRKYVKLYHANAKRSI